jgi:DNA-3-methyladenine glycosylase I
LCGNCVEAEVSCAGFSFVGPTVVYAYMQAIGMVIDHLLDCYRYREILRKSGQSA